MRLFVEDYCCGGTQILEVFDIFFGRFFLEATQDYFLFSFNDFFAPCFTVVVKLHDVVIHSLRVIAY